MAKYSCGPKGKTIEDAVVIGEEEGGLYKSRDIQKQPVFMSPPTLVNCGIEGLPTSITKHYLM